MGQVVPGNVRQVSLLVDEHPRRLLQSATAFNAFFGSRGSSGVPRSGIWAATVFRPGSSPRRRVHQAARQASHPRRESQRRNPPNDRPAPLRRAWRRAQQLFDAERAPHPIHVADFPIQGIAARAVPGADVLNHHQAVRAAHYGADRAVTQQVREPNGNVLFNHMVSVSSGSRREIRLIRRHFVGQSYTFNDPVPSTFRIEFSVAHRPRRDSSCV